MARDYFFVREDLRYRIYMDDGRHFLETGRKRYDIIVQDAFAGTSIEIPRQLSSIEFFNCIKKKMSANGLLATNYIYIDDAGYASLMKTLACAFRYNYRINLRSFGLLNIIIISTNSVEVDARIKRLPVLAARLGNYFNKDINIVQYANLLESAPFDYKDAGIIHDRY